MAIEPDMSKSPWPSCPPKVDPHDLEAVYKKMEMDGKKGKSHSVTEFLATALIGVPIYLSVVLPMSVIYQTVVKSIFSKKKTPWVVTNDGPSSVELEAEQKVIDASKKELSARTYDVVLLGATGFTGEIAAEYIATTYGVGKKDGVKWAIAGRNQRKLDHVKSKISTKLGDETIQKLDTIIVDTSNRSTLHNLVKDTRSIASTAGPFFMYGSSVVEFCAKYGTHYVDISGEVSWNRDMMDKWDKTARQNKSKIVSLCGHDCVPWDLTAYQLSILLRKECNGESLRELFIYDEIDASLSGGTIATMLAVRGGLYVPKTYDVDPYMWTLDGSTKSSVETKNISPMLFGPCQLPGSGGRFQSKWEMPFVMSPANAAVVRRTNAILSNHDEPHVLTYRESMALPNFMTAFVDWIGIQFFGMALANPITKGLILPHLPKPGEGPNQEKLDKGFLALSGIGYGSKGSKVESVMYFPSDPGYKDTARMLVESALSLSLTPDSSLPIQGGGFFSPAASMGPVLLDRLCKTGTMFASRVIEKKEG